MTTPPIITLLTDFGERDGFVGAMKGVILGIVPHAQLVDLSHQIGPQDIRKAAFVLAASVPYFPINTVHLVVIDPGVGSSRRAVAVQTSSARFVAPDNGVLSHAIDQSGSYQAVELDNPTYHLPHASQTFHGRDVFSPAAAQLAAGLPLEELGSPVTSLVLLNPPRLEIGTKRIKAEVLDVDHFGNIRTSVYKAIWTEEGALEIRPGFGPLRHGQATFLAPDQIQISVGSLTIDGISKTFSDVAPGQPVAIVGGSGALEIAINYGNAARDFEIHAGDAVSLVIQS